MIDFYTWITPNGLKVSIALEEFDLNYRTHTIDITKGEQFSAQFRGVNPRSKIPAIVDNDTGVTLAESSGILMYLAEKTGRLMPASGPARLQVIEWLMWQTSGFGPTLGHAHYFLTYNAGEAPFAEALFSRETRRLYETLEARLDGREHIVDDYSIADIAIWPWVSRYQRHKIDLNDFPEVRRWYLRIAERPQVRRGYEVPHFTGAIPMP